MAYPQMSGMGPGSEQNDKSNKLFPIGYPLGTLAYCHGTGFRIGGSHHASLRDGLPQSTGSMPLPLNGNHGDGDGDGYASGSGDGDSKDGGIVDKDKDMSDMTDSVSSSSSAKSVQTQNRPGSSSSTTVFSSSGQTSGHADSAETSRAVSTQGRIKDEKRSAIQDTQRREPLEKHYAEGAGAASTATGFGMHLPPVGGVVQVQPSPSYPSGSGEGAPSGSGFPVAKNEEETGRVEVYVKREGAATESDVLESRAARSSSPQSSHVRSSSY
jgi:hypothetical protein